ncbi:hypothetical protein U9M48_007072 [Paspalum notatum var. saurae]|uniref:Uncharacterized protein n=1 Tax=Paspalum notatum var. saurae TaxID=547442 RepID=A0AAQ3SM36_PASNO
MDPHPTPFPGKRRPVATPAAPALKAAAPKPKSIAAARAARMVKRSPTGNTSAVPRPPPPRRAFGTTRSSNAPAEKPPPLLQKPTKVSPPPLKKPSKLSPPPLQKLSKPSPPAMQKPSKLSPPNPVRATKPSRLATKPLKKVATGANLEVKANKRRSHRVSFQEAAAGALAPGSGEKTKGSADEAAGNTPMVAMRVVEKPAKAMAAETPFFSAQNCSSCTIDQLESAAYWLAQIGLAESVGKHWVAAAFFRLAFECQAQPIHRIQSELRSYTTRHESTGTLTPLFDELLTAHGMAVNQPKFDTDCFEKADTPSATNVVDKRNDNTTVKEDECLECDFNDDLIDVAAVIFNKDVKDGMDQPSFQRKLDQSFEFDDSQVVVVGSSDEANFDLLNELKVPCNSEMAQLTLRPSIEKMSPRSIIAMDSSSGRLSLDNRLDKLCPSMSSSSKCLSIGCPVEMNSPLSSKRLTSSCPSYKNSAFTRDLSLKQMASDRKHNAIAEDANQECKVAQDMTPDCSAIVNQHESKGLVNGAANNEIH